MMIRVEVDRWVAEGMMAEATREIVHLREESSKFEGFVDGYLLQRVEDSHHCVAMSTWRTFEHWSAWEHSEARHDINAKIAPMLDEPESVQLLEPMKS